MKMELLFVKVLTKTDINKRLSVPTVKKRCFLTFEGKHKVEFKVMDNKGKVWSFVCSIRKEKDYPKPVLSKGWLQFVRCWELAVGDKVMVYRSKDKAGKVHNGIEVIRREVSPRVRNHGADRATAVASYTDTGSTDQAVTYGQNEGLHDQPGLKMFEFISLKPDIAVSEPKVNKFLELGSQEQREMEYSSILTLHDINMDEVPVTSSKTPYFKFL